MSDRGASENRWSERPFQALLIRALAILIPLAASIAFVSLASRVVPQPSGSVSLFAGWWVLMTVAATGVLVAVERLSRRLLPLAALCRLSLVFPDRAPSRFRVALRAGDVSTLAERIERARHGAPGETPVEAAERLLELVAALDEHDRLTRGHSERVRAYARMIGQELGLSKRELDLLNWAALLHDVGKLDVAAEILTKPGRPTDEEWEELRRHPERGDALVEPLRSWLGEWAAAVRDHHERWDGRGYPAGKAGDEIALAGRIVAVADVFDVITSARSYKAPSGAAVGRSEIASCAGSQFDPRVVRAFLGVSLGRLRFAMGPLSWLAHAPVLGRLPFTPAVGTATGSLAAVTAAVGGGLAVTIPPEPAPPRTAAPLSAPAPADAAAARERGSSPAAGAPRPRPASRTAATPVPAPELPPAAPQPPPAAAPAPPPAVPDLRVEVDEDQTARVRLEGVAGADAIASLGVVEPPRLGRASASDARELVYEPPPNYHGEAAFGYEACWARSGCAAARVAVTVRPVNDPPEAAADEASTRAGLPVDAPVLANDRDVDGDPLAVAAVAADGEAGQATTDGRTVTFRPLPGFAGRAEVAYTATDPDGARATGTLVVLVGAVNRPPAATDDRATVRENGSVVLDLLGNDADPDGDSLRLVAVGPATAGAVALVDGQARYTPPPDANGPASFTYTVADGAGGTDGGAVAIDVLPVNSRPSFALGPDVTVAEDSGSLSLPVFATAISPGPADEASQRVSFALTTDDPGLFVAGSQPALAPSGTLTFEPAPDRAGTAVVTVRAVDDGGTADGGADTSEPRSFTIAVTPVPDAPVARDDTVALDEDDPDGVTFSVLGNDADADGDALAVVSHDPSTIARGTLTDLGGGSFRYVPAPGASGSDAFAYTVADGTGRTSTATATLVVNPLPDAPEAADDAYVIPQDTPLVQGAPGLLANDADQDGDTLTVATTPVSPPASGTLDLRADGSFTYTPNAGFAGTVSFAYEVSDGTGRSATAVVRVTVSPSIATTVYYLQPSGPSADVWSLSTALPPAAVLVPDHDGDLNPGLTIKSSDGDEDNADPREWQEWVYPVPAALALNGPVTLRLWSSLELFRSNRAGHPYVYLYDCAAGGGSCVKIAETDIHVNQWNGLLSTWVYRELVVGSVAGTVAAGRELRVRLLFEHDDLWLPLTEAYPSSLVVTLG